MAQLPDKVFHKKEEEGELLTYLPGDKYPIRGFLRVDYLDSIRLIKALVNTCLNPFKIHWNLLELIEQEFDANRCLMEADWFCKSGRALYGIAIKSTKSNYWQRVIRLVLLIWEFDFYYRYMFQDAVGELSLFKLWANPRKEILKFFDVLIERETYPPSKEEWRQIKKFLNPILWVFNWKLKQITNNITSADFEEIKLDKMDLPHALHLERYNIKGLSLQTRTRMRHQLNNEK